MIAEVLIAVGLSAACISMMLIVRQIVALCKLIKQIEYEGILAVEALKDRLKKLENYVNEFVK